MHEELRNLYSSLFIRVVKSSVMNGRNIWHVRGRGEVHTGFWWENTRKGSLEGNNRSWGIILKQISKKMDARAFARSLWLKLGAAGRLMCIRQWTFVFHRQLRNSWLLKKESAAWTSFVCLSVSSSHCIVSNDR